MKGEVNDRGLSIVALCRPTAFDHLIPAHTIAMDRYHLTVSEEKSDDKIGLEMISSVNRAIRGDAW